MMAVDSLWPSDISIDVLSPGTILKTQEGGLAAATKGFLHARLVKTTTDDWERYDLEIHSPKLPDFGGESVFTATHRAGLPYPVAVRAEYLGPTWLEQAEDPSDFEGSKYDPLDKHGHQASTADEFTEMLGKALRSRSVRTLVDSLLARINEPHPASRSA